MNITRTIWNFTKSCMVKIVTVRKFRSVCSSIFAGLAGVEGPRVPLMLGDAPSLLEHLESNLENNQLGKHSLTVRPRVTAYYRDRFVRSLFLPYPPSSRSFIVIVDPSFYLVFPLIFFFSVFFIFYVWPRPMRRPEWCLFPQNFSGTVVGTHWVILIKISKCFEAFAT
jgi:hypothetical protein